MPKRTLFTNITPLPPQVTREVAVAMLHNHDEMIELNPLVIEHHPIKTPRDAPADEFLDCVWQELTDKIHYLPGGVVKGKVTYKACFHDTPVGLQTHIYAPMGLDIREKWSIGGNLPGEPPEARELGLDTPRSGLYIREDCDMKCNMFLTSFVRKNLDSAHKVLVERILKKAERIEAHRETASITLGSRPDTTTRSTSIDNRNGPYSGPASPTGSFFQPGSHMANSSLLQNPYGRVPSFQNQSLSPQLLSPQQDANGTIYRNLQMQHPAFRNDAFTSYDQKTAQNQVLDQRRTSNNSGSDHSNTHSHSNSNSGDLPPYQAQNAHQSSYYNNDMIKSQRPGSANPPLALQNNPNQPPSQPKQFFAELPGSTYHPQSQMQSSSNTHLAAVSPPTQHGWGDNRTSMVSELAGSEAGIPRSPMFNSDRESVYSDAQQNGPSGHSGQNMPYQQGPSSYQPSNSDGERRSTTSDMHSQVSELASPDWRKTQFDRTGRPGNVQEQEVLVTYQGNERVY